MLKSKLFSGDQRLKDCEVSDPAHVTMGNKGQHVRLIQQALVRVDNAQIDDTEMAQGVYGQSTANAVLAFKKKRNIINRSYQTQADNVVGKMTIKRLDEELASREVDGSNEFFAAALRPIFGRLI